MPPQNRYCEPQGETESKLAKIWEKLLGTRQVGRHDNPLRTGRSFIIGHPVDGGGSAVIWHKHLAARSLYVSNIGWVAAIGLVLGLHCFCFSGPLGLTLSRSVVIHLIKTVCFVSA